MGACEAYAASIPETRKIYARIKKSILLAVLVRDAPDRSALYRYGCGKLLGGGACQGFGLGFDHHPQQRLGT